MRRTKHGFWDEEFNARVDGLAVPSAEEQFFAEIEEPLELCSHDDLYTALGKLTTRQNFVVRLYFGIECEPMSLRQIAHLMGVHHTTVDEHWRAAERKLGNLLLPLQKSSNRGSTPA